MSQRKINEESSPIKVQQSIESKQPEYSLPQEDDIEEDASISDDIKHDEPKTEEKK